MSIEVWNPGYTKFTYFWGGPFSQWYKSPFELAGRKYINCEQYMMAEKARFFNDEETAALIMAAESPDEHKRLGRLVKNFNRLSWESVCKSIVYTGNYCKFTQNKSLLKTLLSTDGTLLTEASPKDRIWGIGISQSDAEKGKKWLGTNWLGEILTKLRIDLGKGLQKQ